MTEEEKLLHALENLAKQNKLLGQHGYQFSGNVDSLSPKDVLINSIQFGDKDRVSEYIQICEKLGVNLDGLGGFMRAFSDNFGLEWATFCDDIARQYPQIDIELKMPKPGR